MSFKKVADFCVLILWLSCLGADAQTVHPRDSLTSRQSLSEVVVTATRSHRKPGDVPIPVTVITQEQIRSAGASRLDDVLGEQTGLAITYSVSASHGFGIQMEGMDPRYCLILIDGEPMIGQTAGTTDLSRFTVSNIDRIEIIRGPASSLYGSDALAGVINIITKDSAPTGVVIQTQYGSHRTSDLTATASANFSRGSAIVSLNRFQTNGYNLVESAYGPTVPPYRDYTLTGNLRYRLTPKLDLAVRGRYFSERQRNDYRSPAGKDTLMIRGHDHLLDAGVNPVLSYRASGKWNLKLRSYWSWYRTRNGLKDVKADSVYDDSFFRQSLWKEELQSQHTLGARQVLTAGAGFTTETVLSTRFDPRKTLSDAYLYAQHEWHPTVKWNILSGLRYDRPSAYHDQLSPKIAAEYRVNHSLSVRASVGTGYKAPDFEQLYLDFSNPVVGYSVLGSGEVAAGLKRMEAEGLISQVFIDPGQAGSSLKPETSLAWHAGGTYRAQAGWSLGLNLFRNDISNLIDTRVIATKVNGQSVYSYYNLERVFTQGAGLEATLPLWDDRLLITAGYQFLEARDKQVASRIRSGNFYRRNPETLQTERLSMKDYGGLFNRSPHSAKLKVSYARTGWSFNTRLIYRSRFGFADMNGDAVLDAPDEYAKGYMLWHLAAGRELWSRRLVVRAGVKDMLGYRDPRHLPQIPGRILYAGLDFHFYKAHHPAGEAGNHSSPKN